MTSTHSPAIVDESCSTAGVTAVAPESHKHVASDPKCSELGWTCVQLAVETSGNWGTLLAASQMVSKSKAVADIYGHL